MFTSGWGWSVVGAIAIVLAAMYMLRLISAVLHQLEGERRDGGRARPAPAELGFLVPLVVLPDRPLRLAGGGHRPHVRPDVDQTPALVEAPMTLASSIQTPTRRLVRHLAGADLLGASAVCLLVGGARCRARSRTRLSAPGSSAARSSARSCAAALLYDRSPHPQEVIANAIVRDRLGALAAMIICGAGLATVGVSWRMRLRAHVAEYYALLAAAAGGMVFLVTATNLITLFLALEWFSICLYVLCAIDVELEGSLEAGLKYLVVGGFGSAFLLFGSALVYGATGRGRLLADRAGDGRAGPRRTTRSSSPAWR